jgi:hypothetical protein
MRGGCVEFQGRRLTLRELATETGVPFSTLRSRWQKNVRDERLWAPGRAYDASEEVENLDPFAYQAANQAALDKASSARKAKELAKRALLRSQIAAIGVT